MTTLRIAHLADSHFDEKNRLEDNVAVHRAFIEQAQAAHVDLILHAGDFFERRSTPAERNALAEFLTEAALVADVIGAKGNHDADDDLNIFNLLDRDEDGGSIRIFDRPTAPGAAIPACSGAAIGVIVLPWFTKANIAASLPADTPAAETTERTIQAARAMLASLRIEAERVAATGAVPLLVAHVLVAGSETSTGQTLIGSTVELAPSDILDVGCAYAALGHIHKAQSWHDGRVAYSGSPQRMNFGEPEAKGWNLVTIDTERWREPGGVTVEFQELPARAIQLIEVEYDAEGKMLRPMTDTVPDGALVRYRYRIPTEALHMIDESVIRTALLVQGAHSVKLEAVLVHQDRVRCEAIATAQGTFEKLRAFWTAKAITVEEAQRVRVRAKLEEIEAGEKAGVGA